MSTREAHQAIQESLDIIAALRAELAAEKKAREAAERGTCEIKALFDGNERFAREQKERADKAEARIAELEADLKDTRINAMKEYIGRRWLEQCSADKDKALKAELLDVVEALTPIMEALMNVDVPPDLPWGVVDRCVVILDYSDIQQVVAAYEKAKS